MATVRWPLHARNHHAHQLCSPHICSPWPGGDGRTLAAAALALSTPALGHAAGPDPASSATISAAGPAPAGPGCRHHNCWPRPGGHGGGWGGGHGGGWGHGSWGGHGGFGGHR
ncbi:hypothetical protein R2361_26735 [Mycobacteroides chelonae]|nr:hypothetical protein [Mycobacteroides chelonae]